MMEFKSLKDELRKKLNEILSISYKPEEAIYVDDITNALYDMDNSVDKIMLIIDEIKELPEGIKQIIDLKIINESKNKCEEIKRNIGNYISEIDDIFISGKIRDKFINDLEEICNVAEDAENKFLQLRNTLRGKMRSFSGRMIGNLKKLERKINEIKKNYEELGEISNNLLITLRGKKTLMASPEILDLVRSLNLGKGVWGVWAHEIVEKFSGIRSVAGELYTEVVSIEIPSVHEEPLRLTMDQLLSRYPPFEPIQIESDGIRGRFVWFMESTNIFLPKSIQVDKCIEVDENTGKLISIKPFDLLNDIQNGEVRIKIRMGLHKPFIHIKYGSKDLRNLYSQYRKYGDFIKKIQNEYEKHVQGMRGSGKAYSVSNLGYCWYCILGLGLSTDPYDRTCPFKQECPVGRRTQGECREWSWSRRLFPKVYVVPERKLISAADLEYGQPLLFIKPFGATGVRIHELYKRAQWYMPSVTPEGPVVEVHFKKALKKHLPKTNVIGFEIPLSLIKAVIESLLDEKITGKPEISVIYNHHNISLDKLLLSKFFIYHMTKKGLDTFSFLQMKDNEIIKKFNQKIQKGYNQDEVVNFAVDVLGHTLAHLFYSYVSNALEIEPENLLYMYNVDEKNNVLQVAVAENSAWGSLDMVKHAEMRFGSIGRMLEEFVNNIIEFLEKHEEDIRMHMHNYIKMMQNVLTDSKMMKIADELRNAYMNLISNGIVLDTATFLNHIVISGQDSEIAKRLQHQGLIDGVGELRKRLVDAVVASGINTCIDGCTACVMLDHGCTTPLTQNISLSRNLAMYVLKKLSGKESIKGRGNRLGLAVFGQAEKSFFAFSPYLDEEGVKILTDLAQRGVKVVLITHKEFAAKFGERLRERGVNVYIMRTTRHDKFYIIDERVRVITSQNLSKLSSINEFSFEPLTPEKAESIVRQELGGSAVERYRGGYF